MKQFFIAQSNYFPFSGTWFIDSLSCAEYGYDKFRYLNPIHDILASENGSPDVEIETTRSARHFESKSGHIRFLLNTRSNIVNRMDHKKLIKSVESYMSFASRQGISFLKLLVWLLAQLNLLVHKLTSCLCDGGGRYILPDNTDLFCTCSLNEVGVLGLGLFVTSTGWA
mgnify:CR=1 FL=1